MNILDYGAIGDGKTINTEVINIAVKDCASKGGGTVIIPAGVFLTGSIQLFSNVRLFLDNGAVLKSTAILDDFPIIGFKHNEMGDVTSLLWAMNEENISICGNGVVDLSSDLTYSGYEIGSYLVDKSNLSEERLTEGILPKNNERVNQPFFFESCKNINIEGIKMINSPCWTITFSRSRDIFVRSITINNDLCVPNDDGIHFSSCENALVSDCNISCADDCIALTCITNFEGINKNITITNCNLRSRSAAVRIGHYADGVCISNLNIYKSNRGIGIFTRNASSITNVSISNIRIETFLLAGGWWGKAEPIIIAATKEESVIENISISNVVGECENGIIIYGVNHNINNLSLNNIKINVNRTEYFSNYCTGLDLRPYKQIPNENGPFLLYTEGMGKFSFNDVTVSFETNK